MLRFTIYPRALEESRQRMFQDALNCVPPKKDCFTPVVVWAARVGQITALDLAIDNGPSSVHSRCYREMFGMPCLCSHYRVMMRTVGYVCTVRHKYCVRIFVHRYYTQ